MASCAWHCRYLSYTECGLGSISAVETAASVWLADDELRMLSRIRSPHRRRSWVAGRMAAKQTLLQSRLVPEVAASAISIVSRNRAGKGIAPQIFVRGRKQRLSLSFSHSDRGVLIGVSTADHVRLGTDLVVPDQYGAGFRRLWFTEQEQAVMHRSGGPLSPAVFWATKESVYKSLGSSDPFVPRQIDVYVQPSGQMSCRVNGRDMAGECRIHCWRVDGQIAALTLHNGKGDAATYLTELSSTFQMCG